MEFNFQLQKPCDKCHGAGWLWATELNKYHGDEPQFDDTKYTCDRCLGTKFINEDEDNVY